MLTFIILAPIISCLFLVFIDASRTRLIRVFGLLSSLLVFAGSVLLLVLFDHSSSQFQHVERFDWFFLSNYSFYLGVDGLSLYLVVLTAFLVPVCILISWSSVQHHCREYVICFLFLESLIFAVFTVLDLLLFYVFFEGVLIPMFVLIGAWGSRGRKVRAAYQLFVYTLLGSVLMLGAILFIYIEVGTTDLLRLSVVELGSNLECLAWLAFFMSFAVKVPMFPFHVWLPEAHVEAPTAGSVILAGILLKLGGYGLLRFSIGLFPTASAFFSPLVFVLSILSVVYASLTTIQQVDLKKIIAYSSVAHMNFVTLGMFCLNLQGLEGSLFLMLSHGIVSSALFLCVGVLYDRHHSRVVKYYAGLVHTMPLFVSFFVVFSLANLGLPLTTSFVGELLILMGAFLTSTWIAFFACTSMVFGAVYSLWLANRVSFGNLKVYSVQSFGDLTRREFMVLAPFGFLTFAFGIYPNPVLSAAHLSLVNLVA